MLVNKGATSILEKKISSAKHGRGEHRSRKIRNDDRA